MSCAAVRIQQSKNRRIRLAKGDTSPPLPYDVILEIDKADKLDAGMTYLVEIGGQLALVTSGDSRCSDIRVLARVLSLEWLPMT